MGEVAEPGLAGLEWAPSARDGVDFLVVRNSVDIGKGMRAPIRVGFCVTCGYLSQIDRFESHFYSKYYADRYRIATSGTYRPSESLVLDQVQRGSFLLQNLANLIPTTGCLLDVGCGPGGFLVAFEANGWRVQGIDPDRMAIKVGKERFGFDLKASVAEDMQIEDASTTALGLSKLMNIAPRPDDKE